MGDFRRQIDKYPNESLLDTDGDLFNNCRELLFYHIVITEDFFNVFEFFKECRQEYNNGNDKFIKFINNPGNTIRLDASVFENIKKDMKRLSPNTEVDMKKLLLFFFKDVNLDGDQFGLAFLPPSISTNLRVEHLYYTLVNVLSFLFIVLINNMISYYLNHQASTNKIMIKQSIKNLIEEIIKLEVFQVNKPDDTTLIYPNMFSNEDLVAISSELDQGLGIATMDNLRINIINKVSGNRIKLAVGNISDDEVRTYQSRFQDYLMDSLYNEENSFIAFLINYVIPQQSPYEKLLISNIRMSDYKKIIKERFEFFNDIIPYVINSKCLIYPDYKYRENIFDRPICMRRMIGPVGNVISRNMNIFEYINYLEIIYLQEIDAVESMITRETRYAGNLLNRHRQELYEIVTDFLGSQISKKSIKSWNLNMEDLVEQKQLGDINEDFFKNKLKIIHQLLLEDLDLNILFKQERNIEREIDNNLDPQIIQNIAEIRSKLRMKSGETTSIFQKNLLELKEDLEDDIENNRERVIQGRTREGLERHIDIQKVNYYKLQQLQKTKKLLYTFIYKKQKKFAVITSLNFLSISCNLSSNAFNSLPPYPGKSLYSGGSS